MTTDGGPEQMPRDESAEPAADPIELRYRTWFKGVPPRRIRLELPGWAGPSRAHGDGAPAQPWHCQPFVDGSTYGLELVYPFATECRVSRDEGGALRFDGDFSAELAAADEESPAHPFTTFAADHYGFTSSLDLLPPPGYALRLEPHPRFFTDLTGTVPVAVPGHIQRYWPRIFFVVFKAPPPGTAHVFRKGEPYAQLLVVPSTPAYRLTEMTAEEAEDRAAQERQVGSLGWLLAKHIWRSAAGHWFDDKYKQLLRIFRSGGLPAVRAHLAALDAKTRRKPDRGA
jgi:hypothetical protein